MVEVINPSLQSHGAPKYLHFSSTQSWTLQLPQEKTPESKTETAESELAIGISTRALIPGRTRSSAASNRTSIGKTRMLPSFRAECNLADLTQELVFLNRVEPDSSHLPHIELLRIDFINLRFHVKLSELRNRHQLSPIRY